MIIWCAYCQQYQGEAPPFDNYKISHGICDACQGWGIDIPAEGMVKIRKLKAIQEALFTAGLKQDIKAAEEAILAAQHAGVKSVDLLMGVISPLLWTVGDLWASGKITVEEENKFTTFFESIIGHIEGREIDSNSLMLATNVDILLMNSPNSKHLLGIRIVNLWLQANGIRSYILKEGIPFESVILNIQNLNPKFLGISVPLAEQLPAAINLFKNIRTRLGSDCPSFLVGGNSFKQNPDITSDGVTFIADIRKLLSLMNEK